MDRLTTLVQFLHPVCHEFVFVVDDKTPKEKRDRIESWSVTVVVDHTWDNDFAGARNKALPLVTGEWVLVLDPDELPSFQMMQFLKRIADDPEFEKGTLAFLFWTTSYEDGRAAEESEASWHVRMFRAGHGRFYRQLHELVEIDGVPEASTRVNGVLRKAPREARIIHSKSLEENVAAQELYVAIERGEA